MKKAIIAVSFGTSDPEAEHLCIRPVEDALRDAFPQHAVVRAYSSRIIQRKLLNQGTFVANETEALVRLRQEGYGEIAVVPTCIIPGSEYDRIRAAVDGYPVSRPLLDTTDDLHRMAGLLGEIAENEKQPLLVMGHGSEHTADRIYSELRKFLPDNVFLACLEGEHTLERLLPDLCKLPDKTLTVMPLMLTAGVHARKHLGGDFPDSWKSVLIRSGFSPRIRMQGLGALSRIQQYFVLKASEIL